MESKSTFVQAIKAVIWPQRCIFCNDLIFDNDKCTCEKCLESLPYVRGKRCFKCGREKSECTCSSTTLYYDKAVAPFYFENNVRACIHSFKFRHNKSYAEPLSEYLLDVFNKYYCDEHFDMIVCVPLHQKDLRKRKFNQSQLLAENISRKTGIPLNLNLIKKIYQTDKQSGTNVYERFGNVLGVFDVDKNINLDGKNILLIDDVETTGSTLSECGKMMFLAGANKVCCLSVAVTKRTKKGRD